MTIEYNNLENNNTLDKVIKRLEDKKKIKNMNSENYFTKKIMIGVTENMYRDLYTLANRKNSKVVSLIRNIIAEKLGY